MKLGVVGSRSITSPKPVHDAITDCPWSHKFLTVLSGGADGVDTAAVEIAEELGFETEVIEPDWDDWSDGHPALSRNTEIIEESDAVIAVWDGQSNGTRDSIDKALDQGVPIYVEVID